MESVCVDVTHNITEALSSLMIDSQLMIAPDKIPEAIIGSVTAKKVFTGLAPRLCDASSTPKSICRRMAELLRIV